MVLFGLGYSLQRALMTVRKSIIVISGPSGSGKSTLLKRLFTEFPEEFVYSVSRTTPCREAGETDGIEYNFVTADRFRSLISQDCFIEWAQFSGNFYGTSFDAVNKRLESGKTCILDIDLQGVTSVKNAGMNAQYIFVKPPSFEELKKRLIARNTESSESLQMRLQTAEKEIEFAESHPGFHDCVIVNDDPEIAYNDMKQFIFNPSKKQLS